MFFIYFFKKILMKYTKIKLSISGYCANYLLLKRTFMVYLGINPENTSESFGKIY